MTAVGVSAATGEGMAGLFDAVDECREEYKQTYKKELEQRAKVVSPFSSIQTRQLHLGWHLLVSVAALLSQVCEFHPNCNLTQSLLNWQKACRR